MDLSLKDKVAVVTGAGRGIGREIAHTLAAERAKVVGNDFYEDRAKAITDEIKAFGGQAISIQADITDFEQATTMVKKVADEWGTVHILCNNAGNVGVIEPGTEEGIRGDFVEVNPKRWSNWVNINFYGVLNCTRAVLDYMIDQKYGKIVNTISDAGRVGEPGYSVYSGAKAGVVGFTKALAKEVARHCINMNCVAPFAAFTKATFGRWEDRDKMPEAAKQRLQAMMRNHPMARGLQRLGLPSDIANTITFLASDRAQWITGQVLSVSGGYSTVD